MRGITYTHILLSMKPRKYLNRKAAESLKGVATFLKSFPTATNAEIADALNLTVSTAGRHATKVRAHRGIKARRGPRPKAKDARLKALAQELLALVGGRE